MSRPAAPAGGARRRAGGPQRGQGEPALRLTQTLISQGLRIAAGMKLVPVALMYLGSLIFLGVDTARLDVAAEFRKK